jgi:hypothetical protein
MEFVNSLPTDGRNKYDWPAIFAELRANPGVWGVVTGENVTENPAAAQAAARNIRRGNVGDARRGEFEATTRGTTVYARYNGAELPTTEEGS